MMRILILFALCCSLSTVCNAQDIKTSTLNWTSDRLFNPNTGEVKEQSNVIVTTSTSTVEWRKPSGVKETFTISEVVGQWTNINNNGEIIYEIGNEAWSGNITFSRKETGVTIKMILIGNESLPVVNELTITTVQVL